MKKPSAAFADLHVHTIYSDGTFQPEKVVKKALELNLKAVSITDHDCVDGISPAIEAAEGTDLEIVPGVEISASKGDSEIHILGYFIDWEAPFLVKALKRIQKSRLERLKKITRLLRKHGINITSEKVMESVQGNTVGRLHIAQVLVEEKLVKDKTEVFDKYIGDGKVCHVKHERLDYKKAIEMIRKAGGVPVIAHPGTTQRDDFIPFYVEAGLRGIEVYHTNHKKEANERYLKLAKEYNLLVTGGSDCHGSKKGRTLIGKVKIDYKLVEDLYKESRKIRLEKKKH